MKYLSYFFVAIFVATIFTLTSCTNSKEKEIMKIAYSNGETIGRMGHINFQDRLGDTFGMWWEQNQLGSTEQELYDKCLYAFAEGYLDGKKDIEDDGNAKFWKGKDAYNIKGCCQTFYDNGIRIGRDDKNKGTSVDLETLFSLFYAENFGKIDEDSEEPFFVKKLFESFEKGYNVGRY